MVGAMAWLLLFQLAGEVSVRWLQLPLPGPVIGMVLLLGALALRHEVPDHLRATGGGLIRHLMLLVVPTSTGLVVQLDRFGNEWLPIVAAVIGGSVVTMVVTAMTLHLLLLVRGRRPRSC